MTSKTLPAKYEAFWPTFFYRTQFKEKQPTWPASLNLSSKVAIVTGANAGLGLECCRQLLKLGLSHLIIAVRTISKGETAASELRQLAPKAKIEVWKLDMCSYSSVQAFAERAEKELTRLDIALLNAGLTKPKFDLVAESGHEESLTVNYLSTVLLGVLLLPVLRDKRAPGQGPGTLSIVNSGLSLNGQIPLDPEKPNQPILKSFDDQEKFKNVVWYSSSKTLMHMFLWKLTDYVDADDVIVNAVDPGYVKNTDNVKNQPFLSAIAARGFAAMTGRTPEHGASTYIDAVAVKGRESHGCFLTSWKIFPYNRLLYETNGQRLIGQLWEETMNDLGFAQPMTILTAMQKK